MNKKIKKPFIILIASIFTLMTVLTFFCVDSVKADNVGFHFVYTLSQYEYRQNVDLSDPLYYSTSPRLEQQFTTYGENFSYGADSDYTQAIKNFANYLETETNFQSLNFQQYNIIVFEKSGYTNSLVVVYTSPRPLYVSGAYVYSYENGDNSSFNISTYKLKYNNNNSQYDLPSTFTFNSSITMNPTFSNSIVNNDTYMVYMYDGQFNKSGVSGNVVYSDCPVRWNYEANGQTFADSDYRNATAEQIYLANENGFSDIPVMAIDRRTCCPSWIDTSISADDRYINAHSRCGLKNQCFLVQGSSKELRTYFEYEPNEYLKLNKDDCYFDIRYDVQCMGNYSNFVNQFASDLQQAYGDNIHFYMSDDTTYNGGSFVAPTSSSLHVSLSGMTDNFNTYNGSISNYLADKPIDTTKIVINNGLPEHVTADKYINAIMDLNGYSYTSSTAFGSVIPVPIMPLSWDTTNGQNNSAIITSLKITCRIKIVDSVHPEKSSGTATYSYDFMRGSTDNQPDSIIYDDSDIVDYQDDPTYEVPTVTTTASTTEGDTSVTTQTTVITGSGTVNVTNSNVNNNNPQIHVAPSINVNNPQVVTTQTISITDDDGVHNEDFQSLMNKIEEFLDFGDTFYDEYMADILGVIPEEVWKPFAIASAFISFGCMIAFVLRRF